MHPYFNPNSAEFLDDPYPFYRELRENHPCYRSPFGFFAVSRDRDVRATLTDKRFVREYMSRSAQGRCNPAFWKPVMRSTAGWMLFRNPPDHTRLRGLVAKAFTARRVLDMRADIQATVDEVLDRLAQHGEADLMADFANRIPITVICDLLGIPAADRESVRANSLSLLRLLDPVPLSPAELDHAETQHQALVGYLHGMFALRRKDPRDDLTTRLVQAEEQGDRLSAQELTDNVILLFAAGFDTTAALIGNGLLALFRNPDQMARLRSEPALMPNAVEEFLRYDSPVQISSRVALAQTQLGETSIPAGGPVLCLLGSANRDPEVYDQPDRLDIARPGIRVLSFGAGIHHCLGAQLARLEGEIAIGSILNRFPNLKPSDREKPLRRPGMSVRAMARLPVTL